MRPTRKRPEILAFLVVMAAAHLAAPAVRAQHPAGSLVVFNAGSLAGVFRDLLTLYRESFPGVDVRQESSGSLEAARKITDLGRVPDVLAVADVQVIPALLFPAHANWYATFARNSLVLVHSARSIGAKEISADNWWRVLLRPGVRVGRAEPTLDPAGYRALMAIQLAENYYQAPGLAERLLQAMPRRYVRPKSADLMALVQAGELDYAWAYRTMATAAGLEHTDLPPEIDLSDPDLADDYATAAVRVPGARDTPADSVTIRGEPIVYALTIPSLAANRQGAEAFLRLLYSRAGQSVLRRHGFSLVDRPQTGGPGRPPADVFPEPLHPSSQRTIP